MQRLNAGKVLRAGNTEVRNVKGDVSVDFYARAKDELVRAMPERQCCKAAELCGLVKTDGVVRITEGRVSLSIPESSAAVARKVLALLKDVTRPEVQVAVAKSRGIPRGNAYIVRLPDHEDAINLLETLGLTQLRTGGAPIPAFSMLTAVSALHTRRVSGRGLYESTRERLPPGDICRIRTVRRVSGRVDSAVRRARRHR